MSINIYPEIDYANRLNDQQHKIIKDAEGHCLVLAGAGSGKTRMLIYRVCYLLEQGIPASSVLLLTFTNKAAGEMVNRVKKSIGFYPEGLWAGTFHHAGNLILKEYGNALNLPPNFTILDTEDSLSLLKEIANKISDAENLPYLAKVKEIISLSVNTEESIKDIVTTKFPQYSYSSHLIEKIVTKYQKKKKLLNSLDYDDLLFFWYRLMKNDSVGMKLASRFQYILVDEYHDTNKLQSLILYQMAKVHRNILVVGDDAQSIYSFRGATINNILEFPKVHKDAKIFYMDVNYRSTPEILDFANNIISHNRVQFPKKLVSVRKTGVKPVVVKCVDVKDESLFISHRISQLISSGVDPFEISVLFRSRYQVAELEMALNKLRILYIIRGGLRFFEQAHVKDVISYFRVIENFQDEISWHRVFSMCDGIGEKTIEKLINLISQSSGFEEFSKNIKNIKMLSRGKDSLKNLFKTLGKIPVSCVFSDGVNILLKSMYGKYLERRYRDSKERLEDIETMKEISSSYENIQDFLSAAALQEHFKGEKGRNEKPLVLSTIHQAKGLEWKIVFVMGVCANRFPHASSTYDIMALEEERRIFYVAVTRAKEDLYITYYLRDFYRKFPIRESIFIEELDNSLFEEWRFG